MTTQRLYLMAMQRIAVAAMDEVLSTSGLPKTGLFLMAHPKSIGTGRCVFEYAWHKPGDEIPSVLVRAYVDVRSGEVATELHAHGASPWADHRT